ncbi:MAG: bifunctional pyr operon transcriptional regulator/uracil phosphoribosyltransferase PyrR [Phycisphaera sp.]|nr:bifunctional pyr operon transcriptional regulator/uracil phosphoribosyltransferase PyrR [Phycisphaera sp.]
MQVVADEKQVGELVAALADKVREAMAASSEPWAIVGVRSRGDVIAQRLAETLKPRYTGSVDIALYRDDLSEIGPQPTVRITEIDFPMDEVNVLLVDDVVMTGRSTRAALQVLMDFGRPRCIRFAVLVDRGGRELPIAPDFVGLTMTPEADQTVEVHVRPTDDADEIVVFERQPSRSTQPTEADA